MRRSRQQLSPEECIDILQQATSGVLAVMGDGGYPYTVPLSHVYADGHLYFHSAIQGHKVDAIRNDSRCSFCVIAQDEVHPETFTTHFKSVVAFGQIHVIEDLIFHDTLFDGATLFDQTVGERGFAVVNMGNDGEIANV